MYRGCC